MSTSQVVRDRRKRTGGYVLLIFACVMVGGAGGYLSPGVAALGIPVGMLAAWLVLIYDERVRRAEQEARPRPARKSSALLSVRRQVERGVLQILTDDPQDRLRVLGKWGDR